LSSILFWMEVHELAREIHRRRMFSTPDAQKAQAAADALVCTFYGIEPTIDSFSDPGMMLNVRDKGNRKVGLVASRNDSFRLAPELPETYDVIVFAVGTALDEVRVAGWLTDTLVQQAPQIKGLNDEDFRYEVTTSHLFEMPEAFNFVPPDLNVPKVWSYEHKGWGTPYGFYEYDNKAALRISNLDKKLAG
jgi:hypothetical protein